MKNEIEIVKSGSNQCQGVSFIFSGALESLLSCSARHKGNFLSIATQCDKVAFKVSEWAARWALTHCLWGFIRSSEFYWCNIFVWGTIRRGVFLFFLWNVQKCDLNFLSTWKIYSCTTYVVAWTGKTLMYSSEKVAWFCSYFCPFHTSIATISLAFFSSRISWHDSLADCNQDQVQGQKNKIVDLIRKTRQKCKRVKQEEIFPRLKTMAISYSFYSRTRNNILGVMQLCKVLRHCIFSITVLFLTYGTINKVNDKENATLNS